jgi:DsbC/DsbD-like thiol-disulfide interchange protein
MRFLLILTAALFLFGCGSKKEGKPSEPDSAEHEVLEQAPATDPGNAGAAAKVDGVKAKLNDVMDDIKKDREKRTNEIFEQ